MKKALTGPTPEITDQRDAFDVLEGLPKKADDIGEALLPYVPDVYYEGAIGWTGHAFDLHEVLDDETGESTGESRIFVPEELAAEHPDGTVVELPDGSFVTIDLSGAVEVPTEGDPMLHQFQGIDGNPTWVRSVRVALVHQDPGELGSFLYFPGGEDPVHLVDEFVDVVAALGPALLSGPVVLAAEEGAVAINPRYVLWVEEGAISGARVAISGGRTFDVSHAVGDVVAALSP
jgi:hypothetical protein